MHRPAFFRVPAFVLRPAAGQMANEILGSVNCVPAGLLESGYILRDPDVGAVLREGLAQPLTTAHLPGAADPPELDAPVTGRLLGNGATSPPSTTWPPATRSRTRILRPGWRRAP